MAVAIRIIRVVHLLVLIFVLGGWALPAPAALWVYVVFVPAMVLQWWLNEGTCILTNLEHRLRGRMTRTDQEGGFIKSLLAQVMNPLPTDETIERVMYAGLAVLWGVAWFRLLA